MGPSLIGACDITPVPGAASIPHKWQHVGDLASKITTHTQSVHAAVERPLVEAAWQSMGVGDLDQGEAVGDRVLGEVGHLLVPANQNTVQRD